MSSALSLPAVARGPSMVYELVLMIRPDVSSKQIMDIYQAVCQRVQEGQGEVQGSEYWGFRALAYRVAKRAKAHYVYAVFTTDNIQKVYDYLKFHNDILRFSCIKERQENVELPTPLFHSPMDQLTLTPIEEPVAHGDE